MSVAQAIALVLERDPDLRFGETSISCLISFSMFYSNLHSFLSEISSSFFSGKKDLQTMCCSGTCAEWKVGLLQMLTTSH